jgi:hypothetical protein
LKSLLLALVFLKGNFPPFLHLDEKYRSLLVLSHPGTPVQYIHSTAQSFQTVHQFAQGHTPYQRVAQTALTDLPGQNRCPVFRRLIYDKKDR